MYLCSFSSNFARSYCCCTQISGSCIFPTDCHRCSVLLIWLSAEPACLLPSQASPSPLLLWHQVAREQSTCCANHVHCKTSLVLKVTIPLPAWCSLVSRSQVACCFAWSQVNTVTCQCIHWSCASTSITLCDAGSCIGRAADSAL